MIDPYMEGYVQEEQVRKEPIGYWYDPANDHRGCAVYITLGTGIRQYKDMVISAFLMLPLLLLLLVPPVQAQARWERPDYMAAGAMTIGMGADCITTSQALQRGAVERNPFLGQRPATFNVVVGCTLAWGATMLVADALPKKSRRIVLIGLALVSTAMAIHNTHQGR